ncbi:type I methionyl aminopeptidase [Flammeovirga kamogawensis]|uniref:Methionine aminopeptidase n=1 Tax=Flammeovirga kamogawensis TaxID=373891 RepID=A0ABX8GR64_9BACT|nr:type I methionyl aminopeptidase [Flammeovirga kamogawensis]MBB6462062.1 methionyl aminopeptidase [Flammeovirga kamogawensis]QWG05798.1 type I methionyl aminopeptidase [Flammeovirga kamogawensis]TRX67625.1 type I methionyl aminopeptidase [Flammeovirga kamogawensis]
MVYYKTEEEIELMRISADLLGRAHGEVAKNIKEGVSLNTLDKIAHDFIKDNGAHPSFLNYNGFPATLCMSLNDVIVHGIPSDYELKSGDVISLDCGVFLNGFHSDSAYTYPVGEVDADTMKLLKVTQESLQKGVEACKINNRIGDVSFAVQQHAEMHGYGVVRELVGHGLGKNLHEKPEVPNYGKRGRGLKIKDGLVIAIEPMINLGTRAITQDADGWTIRTRDRKPSAHYEHTVAIVDGKTEVLTTFKYIEEVYPF